MRAALLSLLLPALSHGAPLLCRNLAEVDSQGFPARIELTPSAKEFAIKVKEKGSENSAVAKEGHSYFASRVAKSEEARHGMPAYYVSDNPEGDRFSNEERDTATYLFLEPSLLNGKPGKLRFWLHYKGSGYQGEEENSYDCK